MENLEWIIGNMSLKVLGKEEQNFSMELIGELFVMIQISTWQQQMYFADHSIQNLVPLVGHVRDAFHTAEAMTFLMGIKNLFWWVISLVQVKKQTLHNVIIDLEATVITIKM